MPERGAQDEVFSSDNFLAFHGLKWTNSSDNTRFKLASSHAVCRLTSSAALGWHLGVVVLEVVRRARVLD
jgi:hypothetical protein